LVAATLLAPADADMFKPSAKDQVRLGKRVAQDIRKEEKVLPASDPRARMLRSVASRLLATIQDEGDKPWEYSFDVIEDKDLNAFALPGGPVFFYTGLIDKMKTEDEMAAVLAHEITHTRREHWARAYADQQKRQLGLSLILILARANSTITDVASIANELVITLPYSRRMETEADDVGFDMMVKAGYNPQGMVDVFTMLRESSKGGKPPEFLSTHPDDKNRIRRLQDKIAKQGRRFPPQRLLPFAKADKDGSSAAANR
jgi:predicted Zn-dependent protease